MTKTASTHRKDTCAVCGQPLSQWPLSRVTGPARHAAGRRLAREVKLPGREHGRVEGGTVQR
jgi:hypothetical protein